MSSARSCFARSIRPLVLLAAMTNAIAACSLVLETETFRDARIAINDAAAVDASGAVDSRSDSAVDEVAMLDANAVDAPVRHDVVAEPISLDGIVHGDATTIEASMLDATIGEAASGDATPTDAAHGETSNSDATAFDAVPGETSSSDAVASDALPGETSSGDATPSDASAGDVTGSEASTGDTGSPTVPAAETCDSAQPVTMRTRYAGTTCTAHDDVTLSCNPGSHPDVVIRIDGVAGATYSITFTAGLAYAFFLGTSCSTAPLSCGAGTTGTGGSTDGPFPRTRTDYLVIETSGTTMCGPYEVDVNPLP